MLTMQDVTATFPDVADPRGRGRPPKDRPDPVEFSDEAKDAYRRELAVRFTKARNDKDISLRDLAIMASVSVPTLQMIEAANGDPKAITLLQLARALGVPAGWLAFGG